MLHARSSKTAWLAGVIFIVTVGVSRLGSASVAVAQEPPDAPSTPKAEGETPAVLPTNTNEAPFMAPLEQLASVLGSMHFLRTLCDAPEADTWRDRMEALIAAQKPNEADRRQLIASFNSGYRGFESVYRKCTPAARTVIDRYRSEGLELAREIVTRYGN